MHKRKGREIEKHSNFFKKNCYCLNASMLECLNAKTLWASDYKIERSISIDYKEKSRDMDTLVHIVEPKGVLNNVSEVLMIIMCKEQLNMLMCVQV